jgi:hypothetical protein
MIAADLPTVVREIDIFLLYLGQRISLCRETPCRWKDVDAISWRTRGCKASQLDAQGTLSMDSDAKRRLIQLVPWALSRAAVLIPSFGMQTFKRKGVDLASVMILLEVTPRA